MDNKVLLTLRAMAWERAKGELIAYLQTFWPEYERNGRAIDNGYEEASERVTTFIKDNCR